MASRVPVFRRRKQIDSPEADFAEELARLDPLTVQGLVSVELAATTAVQYVPHKLGRDYRGAAVVGQTGSAPVIVVPARLATDADKRVSVRMAVATAQTVDLLVF